MQITQTMFKSVNSVMVMVKSLRQKDLVPVSCNNSKELVLLATVRAKRSSQSAMFAMETSKQGVWMSLISTLKRESQMDMNS